MCKINTFRGSSEPVFTAMLVLVAWSSIMAPLFMWYGAEFVSAPTEGDVRHTTLLISNGSLRYRIREPFDPLAANFIMVVFSPDLLSPGEAQDVERVLAFGQLIAGLYHSDNSRYVLATVNKSSIVVRLRYTSKSGSHTKYWDSPLPASTLLNIEEQLGCHRVWYRLVVCTSCLQIGEIAVIQPPEKHSNSNQSGVVLEGNPVERWSALLRSSTTQRVSTEIMIDSGLYVAGVEDGRTTFGTEKIKPFIGQIAASVCQSLWCTRSTVTTQGINVESYRYYLNTTVRHVLASPLTIKVNRRTTATRPFVFRFPIVTAVSDNHAQEVQAGST